MFLSFIKKEKEQIANSKNHKIVRIIGFFVLPLFILIALEAMHFSDIRAIPSYFADMFWPLKFLLTYTFILTFQCIFFTLFRNEIFSYILTSVIFYSLSLVTYVRCELTGSPLLPSDLLLVKNVKEIASFVEIPFNISYIISLGIMALGLLFLLFIRKKHPYKIAFKTRLYLDVACIAAFCIIVYAFCLNYNFRHSTLDKINVKISAFSPVEDLRSNGVILTFFPRIGDLFVKKPDNYSEKAIEEIYDRHKDVPSIAAENENQTKPNVIIIQNEAWWDPTEMPNVEFSEDPMAKIKALGEKYPYGKLVTPSFTGATCMPEFECISGYSTAFLPNNSYPYIQAVLSDTESLVSTYQKNGYETVALHPYHINFYNRKSAYPLLGFQKVIGMEDMEDINDNLKGWYASDEYAMQQIIKAYENKETERMFCFMVTMQNHGGYSPSRYKEEEYTISASSDALRKEDLNGLIDYAQGVKDASEAFITLTEYFKNANEPVIIAMYGDHLPLLGTDASTYIDGGMADKDKAFVSTEYDNLYYTPYIVWANYDISDFKLPEHISAGNLGLSIMEQAHLNEVPWYQSVMKDFFKLCPVYERYIQFNADGERIHELNDEQNAYMEDYKLLQLDLLNFSHYAESIPKEENSENATENTNQ